MISLLGCGEAQTRDQYWAKLHGVPCLHRATRTRRADVEISSPRALRCARDDRVRRSETPREDRHFQHQQHQTPAAEPLDVAGRGQARRRLPAGIEGDRRASFRPPPSREAGYRAVWQGREDLERRRHPGAGRAASHPHRTARRPRPTRRAATSRRRSRACSSPRIYLPNGNPQPGPKFDYKLAWFERLIAACAAAAQEGRRPGRAGRRLQRRADRARHLPDQILGR